jgi:hypothetical protein
MFLLEGSDLVGKTTLAKELEKRFPTHLYQHLSKPPEKFIYPEGYFGLVSPRLIRDRFHYSEVVYSRVTGRTEHLTDEMVRLIDGYLRCVGTFTIVLTADEEVIRSRMRPDEMYNIETILAANQMFGLWATFKCWDVDLVIHNNVYDMEEIAERYAIRQQAMVK